MTKYESPPERYSNIISEEQYSRVLEIAQDYLVRFGEVVNVSDGMIDFNRGGEFINRFGLDNLIRTLAGDDPNEWKENIEDHFSRILSQVEDSYNVDDFETIKDILGVRVYSDSYFDGMDLADELISRIDFEDTQILPGLRLPGQVPACLQRKLLQMGNLSAECI